MCFAAHTLHLRTLTVLEEMKESIRVQSNMLNALLQQNKQSYDNNDLPNGLKLPLSSSEAVLHMEEQLRTNDDFSKAVVSKFD